MSCLKSNLFFKIKTGKKEERERNGNIVDDSFASCDSWGDCDRFNEAGSTLFGKGQEDVRASGFGDDLWNDNCGFWIDLCIAVGIYLTHRIASGFLDSGCLYDGREHLYPVLQRKGGIN
jgi:hypothetical protein